MILVQFVENFRQAALALPAPAATTTTASTDASAPTASVATETPAPAAARVAPPVAQEINGLAIVWALIKSWWLGLFGKKA